MKIGSHINIALLAAQAARAGQSGQTDRSPAGADVPLLGRTTSSIAPPVLAPPLYTVPERRLDTIGSTEIVPVGEPFIVNTGVANIQRSPVGTQLTPDGDFVIVWESYEQESGTNWDIYGQIFNQSGHKVGAEFKVNTYPFNEQQNPQVTRLTDDGDFIVVWESNLQDRSGYGIYAQYFNATGEKLGDEVQVHTTTTDNQLYPSVARLTTDGECVVAWQSGYNRFSTTSVYYGTIMEQYFSARKQATGNAVSVVVSTYDSYNYNHNFNFKPTVISLDNNEGHGLAVKNRNYNRRRRGIGIDSTYVYTIKGKAIVNTHTVSGAMDDIASESLGEGGKFGVAMEVNSVPTFQLYTYDTALRESGSVFNFGSTANDVGVVRLTDQGQFMALWQSTTDNYIYGQLYDSQDQPVASTVQLTEDPAYPSNFSAFKLAKPGLFVATWGQSEANGDVYARLFQSTYGQPVPPTAIALALITLYENQPNGTTAGQLSTQDPDSTAHQYSLVSGAGDTHNAWFRIELATLLTNAVLSETSAVSVRIRSTDDTGLSLDEIFALSVDPVKFNRTSPVGSVVGILSTDDQDAGDVHTYALVAGEGSDDNHRFSIDTTSAGSNLVLATSLACETAVSYTVRIRSTDREGLFVDTVFTIHINKNNRQPENITLATQSIPENQTLGSEVGVLAADDPDCDAGLTYTLVSGDGSQDNDFFAVVGNRIQLVNALDYETQSDYAVRVRATDADGAYAEKPLHITVHDVNEAPTRIRLVMPREL